MHERKFSNFKNYVGLTIDFVTIFCYTIDVILFPFGKAPLGIF